VEVLSKLNLSTIKQGASLTMTMIGTSTSATVLIFLMSGCATFNALTFKAAENSGVKEQKTALIYMVNGVPTRGGAIAFNPRKLPSPPKGYLDQISRCFPRGYPPEAEERGLFSAILIAVGKFVVDQGLDALQGAVTDYVKKLRASGQKAYDDRIVISSNVMDRIRQDCIVYLRYHSTEKPKRPGGLEAGTPGELGMAMIIRLEDIGRGVVLVPSYVWFGNSVAVTEAGDGDKPPTIAISIAISIREVQKGKVTALGIHTFTFSKVPLGVEPHIDCVAAAERQYNYCAVVSDLFTTLPDLRGTVLSVSVVETGTVSADADGVQAELKALKGAIGPPIQDYVKELLQ
jgi:hypothetical protein